MSTAGTGGAPSSG